MNLRSIGVRTSFLVADLRGELDDGMVQACSPIVNPRTVGMIASLPFAKACTPVALVRAAPRAILGGERG